MAPKPSVELTTTKAVVGRVRRHRMSWNAELDAGLEVCDVSLCVSISQNWERKKKKQRKKKFCPQPYTSQRILGHKSRCNDCEGC